MLVVARGSECVTRCVRIRMASAISQLHRRHAARFSPFGDGRSLAIEQMHDRLECSASALGLVGAFVLPAFVLAACSTPVQLLAAVPDRLDLTYENLGKRHRQQLLVVSYQSRAADFEHAEQVSLPTARRLTWSRPQARTPSIPRCRKVARSRRPDRQKLVSGWRAERRSTKGGGF